MLLNISQAAQALGVSTETIRQQIRAGIWPCYRLGPKGPRSRGDQSDGENKRACINEHKIIEQGKLRLDELKPVVSIIGMFIGRTLSGRSVMVTEFFYKGPLRKMGLRYSGPPWVFLAAVILSGFLILGVIVVKTLVGF